MSSTRPHVSTPPNPPRPPFHEALHHLRMNSGISPTQLAAAASMLLSVYHAMEQGLAPCSRALYDVAAAQFPSLQAYPRPAPDPTRFEPPVPRAVTYEDERRAPFRRGAQ